MPNFGASGADARSETQSGDDGWQDWPTLALFLCVYIVIIFSVFAEGLWAVLGWPALVLALVLHSSLSHEILHGRPFGKGVAGTVAGLLQPGLFIPYLRFKRLHLAHHQDSRLTDPYDDPETCYLDPSVWQGLAAWQQKLLLAGNTLAGRMVLGPALGIWGMLRDDIARIRAGERQVALDWALHVPGCALVLALVLKAPMTLGTYLLACYAAMSVLKIRTFLEHRAHEHTAARTVIIKGQCLLSFLFLNNSFHLVHHMYPEVAWYRLPALYRAQKERFEARNQGYVYRSYGQIIRQYLFNRKEPIAHPLWQPDTK